MIFAFFSRHTQTDFDALPRLGALRCDLFAVKANYRHFAADHLLRRLA
jgi:hypothetical protein